LPRILLIAATTGYQTRSFADAARRQGFEVTLATDRCHVLEDPWRDRALAIRFEEPESSAQMLAESADRPDGIVAVADRSTLVAALAAERIGIPWHPASAVRLCRNKSLMRLAFLEAGLPGPRTFTVPADSAPLAAAAQADFPCVLKPLGLSASRGVIRADNATEFVAAFERIRRILALPEIRHFQDEADRRIQIERYISGREFALEGLMTGGELRVLAIFDKPDPLEGPFFEETIYVTPSRESADTQRAIVDTCRRALKALGLAHGPIHAEMRVNSEGVFMLEIAARPIGGLCARVLRFRPSLTLEELVILHAADAMPERVTPASPASGVMMIPAPGAGVLRSVAGVEQAANEPRITGIEITAKQGERLVPLPEGASYPGFIFAEAPDPAQVETALRNAHALLHFELMTALPTLLPGT
jgi:formate-dependent phosphoribosylglycinamide formyltransferase (GAR transformylase)